MSQLFDRNFSELLVIPVASGDLPWWEQMAQGMPDGSPATPEAHAPAAHYKPARKPYVPRATYAKPWSPSVKWQRPPAREYWWQK